MDNYRKKLIEVALPLEAINKESAREKSIRHGHPSTLHLWWARRPLAACRAVLFASLVDDPSSWPERFKTEAAQEKERQRIFDIIEKLVKWENLNNDDVLNQARWEIARSIAWKRCEEPPDRSKEVLEYLAKYAPPVLDPFCGGGSIPLEAQRLGLEAHGNDLNPVAVLITKALIEIPPKFSGKPPVNPESRKGPGHSGAWRGAAGLAEDVRFYGKWMRDEAEKRIGHLYPKVKLAKAQGEGEGTVIAWIWARTVKCHNPACGAQMPLVRSFVLSNKKGRRASIFPHADKRSKQISFLTKSGEYDPPEGTISRKGARCIVCESAVPFPHVRAEGMAGRMGKSLMAIVVEADRGKIFCDPDPNHVLIAEKATPSWKPDCTLPLKHRNFQTPAYGMPNIGDLFTPRQLVALTTFSDLVSEAHEKVKADAQKAGLFNDNRGINDGGTGPAAYADAVATYLAFAVDRSANYWSSLTPWGGDFIVQTFGRQALPMVWDYAEANPFSDSTGSWIGANDWIFKVLQQSIPAFGKGQVKQLDARTSINGVISPMVCTDPPYYDNISYANLSDFFYVFLRRSVAEFYPALFSTLLVPKSEELIAAPYRFEGNRERAEHFFEDGLKEAFKRMRELHRTSFPLPIFYAFKQAETAEDKDSGKYSDAVTHSTGWETMLEGLLQSGFKITGTWPLRTERDQGLKTGQNVLASSIVLVCLPRDKNAPMATRREFSIELKNELPNALKNLQQSYIAPVDLAQAVIGPGMAVFSQYSKVIEADGRRMSVRTALQIINQELDNFFASQEGDLDSDTRFCIAWFEQLSMNEAPFGEADVLARAKNTSVQGLVEAGVLHSKAGKVRILSRSDYSDDWDPADDKRLTVWECTQHLIRKLERSESDAAQLAKRLGAGRSEDARALAYRLYSICERKKWAQEALAYNSLVVAWPEILKLAREIKSDTMVQDDIFKQDR